ncbi:MAG: ATP-binding protein [Thermoproteus sp.]
MSKKKELEWVKAAEELGMMEPGVYVLYGAPGVGKTTFAYGLLSELKDRIKLYIATEPNVLYDKRLEAFKAVAETEYHKDLAKAFMKLHAFVRDNKNGVAVVDSVSAFAQHEAAAVILSEGRMVRPLELVGPLSFAANAMSVAVADLAVERGHILLFVAQERPSIGKSWRGEDAAPSFAMRALHSVRAVVRIIVAQSGVRYAKVVIHRVPSYERKMVELPPSPW